MTGRACLDGLIRLAFFRRRCSCFRLSRIPSAALLLPFMHSFSDGSILFGETKMGSTLHTFRFCDGSLLFLQWNLSAVRPLGLA
jgi:hypothetical protein